MFNLQSLLQRSVIVQVPAPKNGVVMHIKMLQTILINWTMNHLFTNLPIFEYIAANKYELMN